MATRRILQIDQSDDYAILKSKSIRVKQFDRQLAQLVEDMVATMRSVDGAGLSAIQIGIPRRVVVIDERAPERAADEAPHEHAHSPRLYVFINPEIIETSAELIPVIEGCLSLPGVYGEVHRHAWITVKYQDLQGKEHRLRRAPAHSYRVGHMLQHEVDHLNGILFTERLIDLSTLRDYRQRA